MPSTLERPRSLAERRAKLTPEVAHHEFKVVVRNEETA